MVFSVSADSIFALKVALKVPMYNRPDAGWTVYN